MCLSFLRQDHTTPRLIEIAMRMFPPAPARTLNGSEYEVFGLLEKLEFPDGVALASLNLSTHEYKKWGEVDFVVVSRLGLLVLEVKGGQVFSENGIWRYESRGHAAVERQESPMAQASSAFFSLRDKHLAPVLGKALIDSVPTGFCVVFARTSLKDAEIRGLLGGTEMPKVLVATREDLVNPDSLGLFLRGVIDFWANQMRRLPRKWTSSDVSGVVAAMRPWFDRVAPLSLSVAKVRDEQLALTTEQYQILDFSQSTERLLCVGGAGCGKTLLAVECLRRELSRDPVLVTGTDSLARHLRASNAVDPSRIYSFSEFKKSILRNRHLYRSLIVDEGQQITDADSLEVLSSSLEGGIEAGRWRWFCDPNNQVLPDANFDPKQFDMLKRLSFQGSLTKNCRTTPQIAYTVQILTGATIGDSTSKGHGPEVVFAEEGPLDGRINAAVKEIKRWLEDPEIRPGDIVLLSPKDEDKWSIPLLAQRAGLPWCNWRPGWQSSHDYQGKLAASTVNEFRGLESPFIVLCDMDIDINEPIGNFYIGMTRANFGLMVMADANLVRTLVMSSIETKKTER
jgi:hypothetical protein